MSACFYVKGQSIISLKGLFCHIAFWGFKCVSWGDCLWMLHNLKIRYIQRMNERGLTWFLPTSGFGADQSIPEKYCHSGREVLGTKLPYSSNILSQYWNNGPIENPVKYCHCTNTRIPEIILNSKKYVSKSVLPI